MSYRHEINFLVYVRVEAFQAIKVVDFNWPLINICLGSEGGGGEPDINLWHRLEVGE